MKLLMCLIAPFLLNDHVIFEETCSPRLAEGWSWVREDAKAWKVEDGALLVRALPGSLWKKSNDARNVLLRKAPAAPTEAEPLMLEVTISSRPAGQAEQAGLLLHVDDDNYVKLVRGWLNGKLHVVLAREAGGEPQVAFSGAVYGDACHFRLVWSGEKAAAYYRVDPESEWLPAGSADAPKGEVRVGLCAHGAPADEDRWARFTGFRILKPAR